jgi:hypothetical protein
LEMKTLWTILMWWKRKLGTPKIKNQKSSLFFTCTFWMRCACFSKIFGLIIFSIFF